MAKNVGKVFEDNIKKSCPCLLYTSSAETAKDLIPAWKDYVNHYRKENFSTKKIVNGNKSLDEKEALVNKMAFAEIAKFANVDSSFIGKTQMSQSPMYKWAFFAVVNKLVDIVIPDVVAEDFYQFADVSVIGRGNSGKFTLKSNDLFTVSTNGNSRRHVNADKQFTGEKTLTPVSYTHLNRGYQRISPTRNHRRARDGNV